MHSSLVTLIMSSLVLISHIKNLEYKIKRVIYLTNSDISQLIHCAQNIVIYLTNSDISQLIHCAQNLKSDLSYK